MFWASGAWPLLGGAPGRGPLHRPSGRLRTRPSCCDNSVFCATGSSLWPEFQIPARVLIEADQSITWAPGRACLPAKPAWVNYRSQHSCCVSTVAPRARLSPGPGLGREPPLPHSWVGQPTMSIYRGRSWPGHPGRVPGLQVALDSPSPQ